MDVQFGVNLCCTELLVCIVNAVMRHTSFSFALDVSAREEASLRRHAGASRFAYNQCLNLHQNAADARKRDAAVKVPRSGFDLINAFNAWKISAAAGVNDDGEIGLPWRQEVLAQVFEEAAVDLSRGLQAFFGARKKTTRRRVGFPRRKKKGRSKDSFRIRNGNGGIRVALHSIRLPKIGELPVRETTRRLRRLLRLGADGKPRAKILFATVTLSGGRWHVRINVEAPSFHAGMQTSKDVVAAVGIDRGLNVFAVAATSDGQETWRSEAPKPLKQHERRLQRLSRQLSRTQKTSSNRVRRRRKLSRLHAKIRHIRRDYAHKLSTHVAKTHGHVALEDLHIAGMMQNHHLAKSIADSAWNMFAQKLAYKAGWYGCRVSTVDRFWPSTKTCCRCLAVTPHVPLSQRRFNCAACGYEADRETNAAANCARWSENLDRVAVKHTETQNACGGEGSGRAVTCGETGPVEARIACLSLAG